MISINRFISPPKAIRLLCSRYYCNTTTTTTATATKPNISSDNIFTNEKQYDGYRTLTIVKGKESNHESFLLQQLRDNVPNCGWNKSKSPFIIVGNLSPWTIKQFQLKKHGITNKDGDDNNSNNSNQDHKPFCGFAQQILPNSILVENKSLKQIVEYASEHIIASVKNCNYKKWRIHILSPQGYIRTRQGKLYSIEQDIVDKVSKTHPSLSKLFNHQATKNQKEIIPFEDQETLVQILFTSNHSKKASAYISVSTPPIIDYLSNIQNHIPAGQIIEFTSHVKENLLKLFVGDSDNKRNIHIDHIISSKQMDPLSITQEIEDSVQDHLIEKFIPSRSYLKLLEMEIRYPQFFKMLPNQLVADLGSSPGGWTLYSLSKGCKVVSIDKSPLDAKYFDFSDKKLHFLEQDAFEFNEPPHTIPFDWLIIDMKVPPKKTLELLEIWLKEKRCKHFVVNLKYLKSDFIQETNRFIQANIMPNCTFINAHCLDTSGDYELTLFGTNKHEIK
ncbi:hypothetical protein CYY_003785 [Polysphondylium violaceum]|uniref:Ribosomal RNA methyltransferase FtsJ domain-containing protein n=1 Tax=Polysphondylium violaceum TaxID=133409 RepID=A0A8J4V0V4_9MYCE|nr:hypothetical protein CYY_003785 [Polysphondylium violaceum]